jgi:hypothetical protein
LADNGLFSLLGIEFRPLPTVFLAAGDVTDHEDGKDEKKVVNGDKVFHFSHVI